MAASLRRLPERREPNEPERGCSRLNCTGAAIAAAVQFDKRAQVDRLGLKFGETALCGPSDFVCDHAASVDTHGDYVKRNALV